MRRTPGGRSPRKTFVPVVVGGGVFELGVYGDCDDGVSFERDRLWNCFEYE